MIRPKARRGLSVHDAAGMALHGAAKGRERMITKKSLAEGFAAFHEPWSPRVAGDINDMQVKLAKLEGAFVWHSHDVEDELFLVVSGRLRMEFRDQEAQMLEPGEFIIVPHGTEHRPVAEEPCEVVLLEPKSTLNTGNVVNERTVRRLERL